MKAIMKKIMLAAVAAVTVGVLALPSIPQAQQKCPPGYHYDTAQKKCAKHGD
jgi:hypothetical protein